MTNGPSEVHPGQSASRTAGRPAAPIDTPSEGGRRGAASAADTPVAQERVAAWVRANPMLALLGGIALGVFIGTWMRS